MSVSKEGDIWVVRKRIGGVAKKFRSSTSGFPNTQAGAKKFEAKLVTTIEEGGYRAPSGVTVAEYADRWLTDYSQQRTTPKTQEWHDYLVQKHIKPGLGRVQLSKLCPAQIVAFYAQVRRVDGKPGDLSANSKCSIHRTLNAILNHAVEMEVISRNPIKSKMAPKAGESKTECYSMEQVKRIMTLVEGTSLHVPLTLALHTGMRVGEICGLKWEDVNLDRCLLTVQRSTEQTKQGLREKCTKTGKGRTVEIGEYLVGVLVRHRADQAQRQLAGSFTANIGHVVTNPNGSPHAPIYLSARWREFIRGTDLPFHTFHALRHTHVSMLIDQGEQSKAISSRVGHSNIGTTMDIYGHLMPDAGRQLVKRLDAALGG